MSATTQITPRIAFPREYLRNGRWILLSESSRAKVWLDTVSLEGGGTDTPRGWFLYTFDVAQGPRHVASTKERFEIVCSARTLHHRDYFEYAATGASISHGAGEAAPASVIPESVDETVLEQLCSGVEKPESGS